MDTEKYIGRLLDNRYEILEVIGTGGMAVVYKARCHRLNRLVAIKILKDDLSQDEEFRRRFHAESQAVAMLSHPNIMSVYDTSATDEADYIVMELIDGITLKQYMEKKGVLNWKETLHFAMQIAKALEHAHSRGIVHRDIKPHNVMVLKNGSVKVTDFGIARIMSKSNTLTKEALGSVHYISPEQAKGGRVDNRSDIYSLGVVMYEMMTGRPPYDGESPVAVAIQHINGGAQMPSVLNPNIPGGLEQIIMKAMAQDPGDRYNTATELLYDLEEFRKDPSMLFDFNNTPIDDATRLHGMGNTAAAAAAAAAQQNQARTTAERVAGARSAQPNRPSQPRQPESNVRRQSPEQPERRQTPEQRQAAEQRRHARQQREEMEEKRNKTVTIAVVTCSAIAVIAIIIFLIVLLNGGLFSSDVSTVKVPNLIGQVYAELDESRYPDFEITFGDFEYSDEYESGEIMDQSPKSDEQVAVGTKIKVWVSMGEKQEELPLLENLTGMTEEAARNYLEAVDKTLVPLVREEHSEDVEEGKIIRTEPAAGEQLVAGQTITIYISTGPEQVLKSVPNVIGTEVSNALKIMTQNGFEKVTSEEEDSTEPEGEVLRIEDKNGNKIQPNTQVDVTTELILYYSSGEMYAKMPSLDSSYTVEQAKKTMDDLGFKNVDTVEEYNKEIPEGHVIKTNIPAGTKIDITTSIVLTVSKGEEPTEPPTTQPPETTQAPEVTKTVKVSLPADRTEAYKLTIMLGSGVTVLDDCEIKPGTDSISVQMTGSGVMYYEIYIDGEYVGSEKVDFSA